MMSAVNLLAETHRIRLDDDHTDNMIFLRMRKRLMKRVRAKNAFSSVMFSNILSD